MSTQEPTPLKWNEVLALLVQARHALLVTPVDDELAKEELFRLTRKLQRKMGFAGFESLSAISTVPLSDQTQFKADVKALMTAIDEGKTSGVGFMDILKGVIKTATQMIIPIKLP